MNENIHKNREREEKSEWNDHDDGISEEDEEEKKEENKTIIIKMQIFLLFSSTVEFMDKKI